MSPAPPPRRRHPAWAAYALSVAPLVLGLGCPRPELPVPRITGVDAPQLLADLGREAAAHRQAVGAVRLDYLATDGFFRGDADIAAARDALLRIELRSFFGQPAVALAANGERFVFVDNLARAAVHGPIGAPRLRELLPVSVDATLAVALLLGAPPTMPEGETRYARPDGVGAIAITHRVEDGVWRLALGEEGTPLLAASLLDHSGTPRLKVRFKEHRRAGGVEFPYAGEAEVAGRAGAVRWRWSEVEVNGPELDPGAWELTIPAGYAVEEAPR